MTEPDTDRLRRRHRDLTPTEIAAVQALKDAGERFLDLCETLGESRETSIARMKIEEAVMWAVKHVSR